MKRPVLTPAQARELVTWHQTGKFPRQLTTAKLRQLNYIDRDGWQLNKTGRQEAERLAREAQAQP